MNYDSIIVCIHKSSYSILMFLFPFRTSQKTAGTRYCVITFITKFILKLVPRKNTCSYSRTMNKEIKEKSYCNKEENMYAVGNNFVTI